MKYRQLADTGVFVSELCLGTMTFGGRGQMWESDRRPRSDGGRRASCTARSTPGSTSSTPPMSTRPASRRRCSARRSGAGATRSCWRRRCAAGWATGANQVGLSRLHILEAVEASLKRLGTDYIDLYQIHRFDPLTNIEDTLRALDDLVRAGKVRYIGCSNLAAWQLMKALAISREQRLERFRCTQSYYSLAGRELERETIPLLKDQGLGLLVWSPLAGGFLSGKFTRDGRRRGRAARQFDFPPVNKEKGFDILDVLRTVAGRRGASVAQMALAWILANDAVTSVIIGARKLAQLDDNLKSVDVALSAEDLTALDEASKLSARVPGLDGRARIGPAAGRATLLV